MRIDVCYDPVKIEPWYRRWYGMLCGHPTRYQYTKTTRLELTAVPRVGEWLVLPNEPKRTHRIVQVQYQMTNNRILLYVIPCSQPELCHVITSITKN